MAGNIIPAIATTNAVIAGLIVVEALKILQNRIEDCRTVSGSSLYFNLEKIYIITNCSSWWPHVSPSTLEEKGH